MSEQHSLRLARPRTPLDAFLRGSIRRSAARGGGGRGVVSVFPNAASSRPFLSRVLDGGAGPASSFFHPPTPLHLRARPGAGMRPFVHGTTPGRSAAHDLCGGHRLVTAPVAVLQRGRPLQALPGDPRRSPPLWRECAREDLSLRGRPVRPATCQPSPLWGTHLAVGGLLGILITYSLVSFWADRRLLPGLVDNLLMRLSEIVMSVPCRLYLILALRAAFFRDNLQLRPPCI